MSQSLRFVLGMVAYVIGLTVLQAVSSVVLADSIPIPTGGNAALWAVMSNVIQATVLTAIVATARIRGWRLAGGVALAWWVVASATAQLEAIFFRVVSPSQGWRLLLFGVLVGIGLAIISLPIERFLRTSHKSASTLTGVPGTGVGGQFSPGQWAARLLGCGAIYVVLYYTAGMLVMTQPAVREFYGQKQLPALAAVIALQLLVRGPIFGVVLAVLAYLLGSDRRRAAIAGAAVMCLIGGAAPLIVPNPFFPDAVRWAHFVEVVSSNLVFGALAGWLMTPPHGDSRVASAAPALTPTR
jgi:hypothetical protein